MEQGGLSGAVFNAAKEHALDAFIEGKIGFTDMASVVEVVLDEISNDGGRIDAEITLDNVTEIDHLARQTAEKVMMKRAG